ncbi:hypothetical protein JOB18_033024 [Scomber scombrus]|uniref:Secreted protein n=1 Tax=Scomber scombrus TaxID=13677 RepID=A0AAV1PJV7_SCOSC
MFFTLIGLPYFPLALPRTPPPGPPSNQSLTTGDQQQQRGARRQWGRVTIYEPERVFVGIFVCEMKRPRNASGNASSKLNASVGLSPSQIYTFLSTC